MTKQTVYLKISQEREDLDRISEGVCLLKLLLLERSDDLHFLNYDSYTCYKPWSNCHDILRP